MHKTVISILVIFIIIMNRELTVNKKYFQMPITTHFMPLCLLKTENQSFFDVLRRYKNGTLG